MTIEEMAVELKLRDIAVEELTAKVNELTKEKVTLGQSLRATEQEYYDLQKRFRGMAASIVNPPGVVPKDEYEQQTLEVEALRDQVMRAQSECAIEKRSRMLLLRVMERLVQFEGE